MKIVSSWALTFPVHIICRLFIIYQFICNKLLAIKGPLWAQMTKGFFFLVILTFFGQGQFVCLNWFNNHSCFQAQHLEPHLVSLLESKLASLCTNKDWPCTEQQWPCLQLTGLPSLAVGRELTCFWIWHWCTSLRCLLSVSWTFALGHGVNDDTNWKLASWKMPLELPAAGR